MPNDLSGQVPGAVSGGVIPSEALGVASLDVIQGLKRRASIVQGSCVKVGVIVLKGKKVLIMSATMKKALI